MGANKQNAWRKNSAVRYCDPGRCYLFVVTVINFLKTQVPEDYVQELSAQTKRMR